MIELLIIGILEQGFIYGIMAMGVYITYTILDFPDLSVDGTFPLGIAVCFVLIRNSVNPWLALLIAFAAGCVAGAFTGIFNVKLKIRNLLCGILTMTALYSINYGIVGKASDFLLNNSVTIFSQTEFLFKGHAAFYANLVVIIVIALIAKFALDWYMRTNPASAEKRGRQRKLGNNPGSESRYDKNNRTCYIQRTGSALRRGLLPVFAGVQRRLRNRHGRYGSRGGHNRRHSI